MHYTKQQIERLGIKPRERKMRPDGTYGLLPVEQKEVKAVVRAILVDGDCDELWQFWRLIPYEDGYACSRRKDFEAWVADEVENMWYDIGRPVFSDDGSWICPEGGWWPYLDKEYLDVSWLRVGSALIDMDEIWTTLRNYLEDKVHGYRMCPGMMLYRIVSKMIGLEEKIKMYKGRRLDSYELQKKDEIEDELNALREKMVEAAKCYPTNTTRLVEDREWIEL